MTLLNLVCFGVLCKDNVGKTNQKDGQNRKAKCPGVPTSRESCAAEWKGGSHPKQSRQPASATWQAPKQMPPKTMLLLISQCFHLPHYFRFLSGLNFIVVRDLHNFRQYLQFSHSLTNKCEQNHIQSEKPLIHDEISTSIIRFES